MRALLVALLIGVLSVGGHAAEPFPAEGWWHILEIANHANDNVSLLKVERLRQIEPKVLAPGVSDPLDELREHPHEAWLLTLYRYDVHRDAADMVKVRCTKRTARISGDSVTFRPGSVSYRIVNKEDRTELHLVNKEDDPVFSGLERQGNAPAELFRATPESLQKTREMVMRFFQ